MHLVATGPSGAPERTEHWLARAKCTSCRKSSTCRPDELYPRRQYQLDVVADVVAQVALGAKSAPAAARTAGASPTSARRWTAWVAALAEPADLLRVATSIEPSVPAGIGLSHQAGDALRHRAARVLAALEQLGTALVRRGVALAARTGLGRVLGWQRALFGDVVHLVAEPKTLSPALARGSGSMG